MSYSYIQRKKWQSSGRPRFHVKAPVEVDKEYTAEIEDVSRRGEGIAKIEGFVIFVPNTKHGDQAKFRITRVGNRFAIGELTHD